MFLFHRLARRKASTVAKDINLKDLDIAIYSII